MKVIPKLPKFDIYVFIKLIYHQKKGECLHKSSHHNRKVHMI